mgnify:CR=1 FL=1
MLGQLIQCGPHVGLVVRQDGAGLGLFEPNRTGVLGGKVVNIPWSVFHTSTLEINRGPWYEKAAHAMEAYCATMKCAAVGPVVDGGSGV